MPLSAEGLTRLKNPVLPLVHIVQWLYLSGPFRTVTEMLPQLSEPIEMDHGTYHEPAALLQTHGEALRHLEASKMPPPPPRTISKMKKAFLSMPWRQSANGPDI